MYFTDEKDYIMRMIKEMVRVLFSLMFGKKYVSVELEKENKYEVSGKNLKDFLDMIIPIIKGTDINIILFPYALHIAFSSYFFRSSADFIL